jgi:hypothetical protein
VPCRGFQRNLERNQTAGIENAQHRRAGGALDATSQLDAALVDRAKFEGGHVSLLARWQNFVAS